MNGMTGFAEAARSAGALQIAVRVHGVNHRLLDVVLRLPEEVRPFESRIRERIAAVVRRGRCEMSVELRRGRAAAPRIDLDQDALVALHRAAQPLVDGGLLRPEISLGELLREPALLRIDAGSPAWSDADTELLLAAVDDALGGFSRARAEDGAKSRRSLESILVDLEASKRALREGVPVAVANLAAQLRTRFEELSREVGWSEERFVHEAALLAERADVREEIERFAAHLEELVRRLRDDDAGGRAIDFVAQELLRELNTLAAKCRDVTVVQTALRAKLLCEQIREQAQNVE
jgi:uncharacterized protein (TIGR00255 family)